MTNTLSDDIQNHLPTYLLPDQKEDLLQQIKKFPNINHYINKFHHEVLQGDGWTGFTIRDFISGEKKLVRGVIISNSCDIDPANYRDQGVNVIFVPLVKLEKYINLLCSLKLSQDTIDAKVNAIRKQKVTSIVYFPKGGSLDNEYIINLDDIHSQPLKIFLEQEKGKLFTLSQAGFYLLVLKMSIHFCRFQEGVLRYEDKVNNVES